MMQVHEHFDMFGCHRFITFVTMCPFSLETEWLPSITQEDFSLIAAKKDNPHSFTCLVFQHFVQLLFGDRETFTISAVYHQDDDLREKQKPATVSE